MVVKLTSNVSHKFEQTDTTCCKRITRQISLTSNNSELEEGESLDSLESIHVYALSNLLCRPIIVVSEDFLKDADGRDVAPIPFGGIYLPLEQDIKKCFKYPLVLAYESSHFSSLVPADGDDKWINGDKLSSSVPLQAKDLSFLPVKYAIDPGSSWDMVQDDSMKEERDELTLQDKILLLRKYLDVVKVPSKPAPPKPNKDLRVGNVINHVNDILIAKSETQPPPLKQSEIMVVAAKLNLKSRPKYYKEMIQNFIDNKMAEVIERKEKEIIEKKCPNCCKADGLPGLNGYCEWCYERSKIVTGKAPSPKPKSPLNTLVRRTNNILLHDQVDNPKIPTKQSSPILKRRSSFLSRVMKESSKQCEQKPALPTIKSAPPPTIHYPPSMEKKVLNDKNCSAVGTGLDSRSTSVSQSQPDQVVASAPEADEFKLNKHCKATGCKFYGSEKTSGFCSSCYRYKYNSA